MEIQKRNIENSIQKEKLDQAEQKRKQLQTKLKSVENNITSLEYETKALTPIQPNRRSHRSADQRKKYIVELKKNDKKANKRLQELSKKEEEKQKSICEKENEIQQLQEQEKLEEQKLELLKQNQKEEKYIKNLDSMMEKSNQRREKLTQQYKHISKSTGRTPSPLHERMQKQYSQQHVLPALNERSEILAKRKLEYQSVRHSDIQEHARHHDQQLKEINLRRKREKAYETIDHSLSLASNSYETSFTRKIREQDAEAVAKRHRVQSERKRLKTKRDLYSGFVREMYTPTIDIGKQIEMKIIQEKNRQFRSNALIRSQLMRQYQDNPIRSNSSLFRRKIRPNSMIPPEIPKREAKTSDYLAEQRIKRSRESPVIQNSLSWRWVQKPDQIVEKQKRMEAMIGRQELREKEIGGNDVDSVHSSVVINDMLVDSIRAKISMLNNM